MAKIVTVCARFPGANDRLQNNIVPVTMSYIRWFEMSEALARRGHEVDIAVAAGARDWPICTEPRAAGLPRIVPLPDVDWSEYDVVKTFFHRGYETLEAEGGADHPFVIAELGSVVAPREVDGIYFYGETRARLYATQERIRRACRFVIVLSEPARALWNECHGPSDDVLVVPSAAPRELPPPAGDPYPADGRVRVLFSGNVYTYDTQPEANAVLLDKLNRLGRLLAGRGARLYMTGFGAIDRLDRNAVSHVGVVPYERTWDYFRYADVGIVVSAGAFMHNNESSKIYYYLRAGLPVVSEAGFPNDHVVEKSRLGFVVESENMERMAESILEAARTEWDRERAVEYILGHHTWDARAAAYDAALDLVGARSR